MGKNPYIRKLSKPSFIQISTPPDIWSHIYGISSALGFVVAIIVLVYNYNNPSGSKDFNFVVTALTILLAVVLFIFLISVIYFINKNKQLGSIPAEFNHYKQEYEKHNIIINQLSECSHIITHYYRNIDYLFQTIINEESKNITDDIVSNAIEKFDYFLINITTNLQSYFSQITDDNCSITIKLLNYNDKDEIKSSFVKTYFRDPVNFKKRIITDGVCSPCSVFENTAFGLIMNPAYQNIYFAEDDLPDLYSNHNYINPNPDWHKHYHSTLVVPISIVISKDERNIIGFLSVDNFKGGLAVHSNKEYLFFVADLLYLAFSKLDIIMNIAKTKNIQNDKTKRYTDWD